MVERPVTILVVDDEESLTRLVAQYLNREGYRTLVAHDGSAALDVARRETPDLIVLDLMLPEIDGLEVCRQMRQFSDAYVIMLTARTEEIDRVVGLSVGADDYVTKPFSPRELVARIRAMLRRPRRMAGPQSQEPPDPLRFDRLLIDLAAHEVSYDGASIPLTPLEFRLLTTLARHPGLVYTRADLLEHVWGGDFYGDDHVVDVHISNLRRKIERGPASPQFIETVRGVGYRFRKADR